MNAILGQVVQQGGGRAWSFGEIAIAVIIIIAVAAIVIIFVRYALGVEIPVWVWKIVGSVVGAFVAILAVRFLLSL